MSSSAAPGGRKGKGKRGNGKKGGASRNGGKNADAPFLFSSDAVQPDESEQTRFHCKCKKFSGRTSEDVAQMILDGITEQTSVFQLVDCFKRKAWDFAFIGVRKGDAAAFEAFCGSLKIEEIFSVEVKEAAKRASTAGGGSASAPGVAGGDHQEKDSEDGGADEVADHGAVLAPELLPAATSSTPASDAVSGATTDRFGYRPGHIPTLMELKTKIQNWNRQKDVLLIDKVTPLYSQYSYAQQMHMKQTYTRTTCKNILRRMVAKCTESSLLLPKWADVNLRNHGIITEPILTCPKHVRDAGYRNKCELSCGVALQAQQQKKSQFANDSIGPFEVGFVQRMDFANEQVIGPIEDLPHIPGSAKKVAEALKRVIIRSGLPVYRRHAEKRAGFWRLVMCRVVDTKLLAGEELREEEACGSAGAVVPHLQDRAAAQQVGFRGRAVPQSFGAAVEERGDKTHVPFAHSKNIAEQEQLDADVHKAILPAAEHKILLVIQTTACHDAGVLAALTTIVEEEFAKAELNLLSVYWQMNDGMSDAFDTHAPLVKLLADEAEVEEGKSDGFAAFRKEFTDARGTLTADRTGSSEDGCANDGCATSLRKIEAGLAPADGEQKRTFEFIRGLRGNKYYGSGTLLSEGANNQPSGACESLENCDNEEEEHEQGHQGENDEQRTATGNLMRARTKTEKKKKRNKNVNPEQRIYHVLGQETLQMPLCGLRFTVGPSSFFQTNSAVTEKLYTKALTWAGLMGGSPTTSPSATTANPFEGDSGAHLVLDICSGVGTIGCIAAKSDPRCQVVGVELIPEAVVAATANAKLNELENCLFFDGKAELVLPELFSFLRDVKQQSGGGMLSKSRFAPLLRRMQQRRMQSSAPEGPLAFSRITAIVDPPRNGLHKDVLQALRRNRAIDRLVYVSCNPDTLVDDVVKLCSPDADVECERFVPFKAVPVDMFPHTLHLEMVLYLERYDSEKHDALWDGEPLWVQKMKAREEKERRKGMEGDCILVETEVVGGEPETKKRKLEGASPANATA